jgi:hypothetical protein
VATFSGYTVQSISAANTVTLEVGRADLQRRLTAIRARVAAATLAVAETLTDVQNDHPALPPLEVQYAAFVCALYGARYGAYDGKAVAFNTTQMAALDAAPAFWRLVALHEFRHHMQAHLKVLPKRVVAGYYKRVADFVAVERDADDWARREFARRYARGGFEEELALRRFLRPVSAIEGVFRKLPVRRPASRPRAGK